MNEGCIPTKTLLRSAEIAQLMRRGAEFGVPVQEVAVDMATIVNRKEAIIRGIREGIYRNLARSGITLLEGTARFRSPTEIEVGDTVIQSEKTIIAAGSRTRIPTIDGLDEVDYLTSSDALNLFKVPESLIIVGGGYIALEYAQMYNGFGSRVTVLGRNPQIAKTEDQDIANTLARLMREDGIAVHTDAAVISMRQENGRKLVTVRVDGTQKEFQATDLLIATGRIPNGDQLHAASAGIELRESAVTVDEQLRTSASNIWAIGDVIGGWMFTHKATYEGPYAALNAIRDAKKTVDYRVIPRAIFTHPPIGAVGLTEKQAGNAGYEIAVGSYNFENSGRAQAIGEARGRIKVVAEKKSGKILGFHILGPHADDLIHEAAVAMTAGDGTLKAITSTIHIHPTLSEAVKAAAKKVR